MSRLQQLKNRVSKMDPVRTSGRITQMVGLVAEAYCPPVSIGDLCQIEINGGNVLAEVVGFKNRVTLLMPFGDATGLRSGTTVICEGRPLSIKVGHPLLGRVVDALGSPIDGDGPLDCEEECTLLNQPPEPMSRMPIREPLPLGVRALDGMLTVGKGQRVGIFSGSGVGKSTLLGMMARNTKADVNVIAMIGERGREVRDFIEHHLADDGLRRSTVVVATSDQPPLMRLKGAFTAMTIAEYFRDQGMDVLFMMDSVTRFAMAQREVGLAAGEPPTARGYTPSVFTLLPKFLERAGTSEHGTITALCTVLVEGDDFNEPISDHARAILDGHIVLTRNLANQGHYPSVDVLTSVSRLMNEVSEESHIKMALKLKEVVATYQEAEELINLGAYKEGSNPRIDYALSKIGAARSFLRQDVDEKVEFNDTVTALHNIFDGQDSM